MNLTEAIIYGTENHCNVLFCKHEKGIQLIVEPTGDGDIRVNLLDPTDSNFETDVARLIRRMTRSIMQERKNNENL